MSFRPEPPAARAEPSANDDPELRYPLAEWPQELALDPYLSRMPELRGAIAERLFRLLFDHIPADEGDLQAVRDASQRGSLVYVMRTPSLLDHLFLARFLARHGLPLARYANGVETAFAAPLRDAFRALSARRRLRARGQLPDALTSGYLASLLVRGDPVSLFLRQNEEDAEAGKDVVEALVEAQKLRQDPIFLVPQVIVWERAPDRAHRGLLDYFLGDPDSPSRTRKLLHFLRHRRHAVVRIGRPVDLRAFLAENEGQPVPRVAKKLRWLLLGFLWRERKVVKGPSIRPRRVLFERILQEPAVRTVIAEEATRANLEVKAVEKRAFRILDKTGADFRMGWVLFLKSVIDIVVSRVYSGVEFAPDAAEKLRQAARDGTVVLVPSHRSHFDYLLLSWVMFYQGMVPPHIAAGVNLSFWPVGPIFRGCGAYFIRRSFQSDNLYKTLLEHYVRALIGEGYTQEFFIEGTRSRTGKMLPPKIGLLATYVEAMADRLSADVQIVPVHIAYEKVAEERSYQQELTGGSKQSESAKDLVTGASILKKRFGRVYVRVNEPVSLRDALGTLDKPYRQLDEDDRRTFLKRLGQHIVCEIQDVAVVTPPGIAGLVLMTHDRRGMTRETFLRRARYFQRWLEGAGAAFSQAWERPQDALKEAIAMFADTKLVEVIPGETSLEDIIAITQEPARRITLDYYKNCVIHLLVPAAYICTALGLAREERSGESLTALRQRFEFLLTLFDEEFMFHPDVPAHHLLAEAGRQLEARGVVEVWEITDTTYPGGLAPIGEHSGPRPKGSLWTHAASERSDDVRVRVKDEQGARLLSAVVRNFYEAYYVVLEGARVLQKKGPMPEKALVDALIEAGRRMWLVADVTKAEAISKSNITNALKHWKSRGVFVEEAGEAHEKLLRLDAAVHEHFLEPLRKLFSSRSLRPHDGFEAP